MSLQLAVSSDNSEAIIQLFMNLLGPTQAQRECISCNLYQTITDANILYLEQRWQSQQALEAYIRSEDYKKILAAIDMAEKLPMICFDTISKSAGFEFIEYVIRGHNQEGD